MYTAVRIVKMNAWRKLTRISKPVIATSSANENGAMTTVILAAQQRRGERRERHEDEVAGEHVGEESDHQRERPDDERRDELDRDDEQQQAPSGTPGGNERVLQVVAGPCFTTPTTLKMTHVASASAIGIAKRAFAGNCTAGMISVMLLKKMKKNSAVRYGR